MEKIKLAKKHKISTLLWLLWPKMSSLACSLGDPQLTGLTTGWLFFLLLKQNCCLLLFQGAYNNNHDRNCNNSSKRKNGIAGNATEKCKHNTKKK